MAELRPMPQLVSRRAWLGGMLSVCAAPLIAQPAADARGVMERQVKAAYLLKFASFVEWPAASFARGADALEIGVAGGTALAAELERVAAGRQVAGRALRVRQMAPGDALNGLHMLFLDASLERNAQASLLAAAHGLPVLTVSDATDATAQGCMIGFLISDQRVRFDIGLAQVAPSGLRIGARMLAVAHSVRGSS